MSDLIDAASAQLDTWIVDELSRTVTYKRGSDTVEISAAPGRTEFPIDSETAVLESYESRDWITKAADLVLDGSTVLPERGDQVRDTQGATVYVYEVMAPAGQNHYRYADDPYRRMLRIHTKLVGLES